jgi:HD-like signal output (HDOD) protein
MSTSLLENPPRHHPHLERKNIFECLEDPLATAVLPSLESILVELESLTRRGGSHMDEITRVVRLDQSMSMQVLRIANSAYYAPSAPIADVPAALLYIGLGTLRGAVASTRCMERTCHVRQDVLDWKEFWTHSASVGHLTMELASRLRDPGLPFESFYLMGLFHDIGKVVLACLMPEEFTEIYTRAADEGAPSVAVLEVECLGVEHGHIGAWYMEKQGIPLTLREPVRFHHSGILEDKPHFHHAALIRLADHLVHDAKLGHSGNMTTLGDPYASPEWKWYRAQREPERGNEKAARASVARQIAKISCLMRETIL